MGDKLIDELAENVLLDPYSLQMWFGWPLRSFWNYISPVRREASVVCYGICAFGGG